MNYGQELLNQIELLKQNKAYRSLKELESPQDRYIVINGKKVVNLCSNNYLGLAAHPALKKASIAAIKKYGTSSGASRLISGNNELYSELEQLTAKFKHTESCLIFNSGYTANLGIITALAGKNDIIFSDKNNHASIVDGIMQSGASFARYPHKNTEFLENEIIKAGNKHKNKFIITDTVFSMDGDIAPLKEIARISKKYRCVLIVDEAHATGVMGKNGSGVVEFLNVADSVDVHMGTFSKALGSFGAYACGKKAIIDTLINRSRSLIYTTALPPSVLSANIAAIKLIGRDLSFKKKLWENIWYFKSGLSRLGIDTSNCESQIFPIITGDNDTAMKFSEMLFKEGIYAHAIRPPTVPPNRARLRITLMASHTRKDLNFVLDKLNKIKPF